MSTNFTEKQREVVARKMGYDGPMQMFDEYLASSPSDATRFAGITSKVAAKMAKGGLVKKYVDGGVVTPLTEEQRNTVVSMAKERAAASGKTPEQELYSYAQTQNLSNENINTLMGLPANATQNWLDQQKTGFVGGVAGPTKDNPYTVDQQNVIKTMVDTGKVNANTGVTTYTTAAPTAAPTAVSTAAPTAPTFIPSARASMPLTTAEKDMVKREAQKISAAQGISPEQALYNYSQSQGLSEGQVDELMGFPAGTTANWKKQQTTTGATKTTAPFAASTETGAALPTLTTATAQQAGAPPPVVATEQAATTQATTFAAPTAAPVGAPTTITSETITPDKAQTTVQTELDKLNAEQGVVSEESKAKAATKKPKETAVADITAASGTATKVGEPLDRVEQLKELLVGTGVDQTKVTDILNKFKAEEGVVTEDMTTQGQLNKMLANFDAGAPPPWAAATMRTAMATLSARGLGASSMAGQAIVQAALEAAAPIAQADAKVFETMGLTNLSNRQQTAILLGQQRAAFLGQEFDQTFQTKVLNAAKISDIANRNFDASVTIALENARITSTMDVANLSAKNAMVLATAAQTANLETANLSNKQQVAMQNAQAFLTMDVKNLDNNQQTSMFKAQQISQTILSDTAATNAAKATNAANSIEVDRINETLALTASQFNAAEANKVNIVNANAANELSKFNAQEANNRAEFNANNATTINVANAKILADISTSNTISANSLAAVNAKNATDLSSTVYAQQSTTYRDLLQMSATSGENNMNRMTNLAIATITSSATTANANIAADATSSAAIGGAVVKAVEIFAGTKTGSSLIDKGLSLFGL